MARDDSATAAISSTLPLPTSVAGSGLWPSLHHFSNDFGPCSGDQLAKLCEGRTAIGWRSMIPDAVRQPASVAWTQLCRFARKRSRAGQRLRPGDELDPDQERSIRLNARAFQ